MTPQLTTTPSGTAFLTNHSQMLQLFFYLQVLDFLTTLIGFRLGAAELSPFVRWLTDLGPGTGVLMSKGIAVVLAGFCVWRQRFRIIRLINYWYAGLVMWNLMIIIVLVSRH